jgi:uncharacterized membrane protein YphA (DoxX/SURF4 family)
MRDKVTLEGHSLIFNILFVVLNLVGLTFVVLGYHENFTANSTLFKSLGWIMMMLSIGGLIVFRGRLMMSSVSRVLVGGLFIVSGLVKANDPIGFSYKLEEYFEDGALAYRIKEWFGAPGFSLEWLIEHALLLSVIICIAEIVLGVLTIIGGKIKLVSYLMLFMMLFFTFLTWHTSTCEPNSKFLDHDTYVLSDPGDASMAQIKMEIAKSEKERAQKHNKRPGVKANPKLKYVAQTFVVSKSNEEVVIGEYKTPQCVDDCGCFGDALKGSVGRSLTPSESLWKDIVLLYLVIWIFLAQWIIKPNTKKENLFMGLASFGVIVFFSWVFGWYFPLLFGGLSLIAALWILTAGKKLLGNHYGSALVVTILSLVMVTYVLMYEPMKDYRAYAVGSNLKEKMNDGIEGKYENILVYKNKKTGKLKEMTEDEYMSSKIWEDSTWEYKDRTQRTIIAAKNPSIMDFNPTINIANMSDDERNFSLVRNVLDTSMTQTLRLFNKEYQEEEELPLSEYVPEYYPEDMYDILDTLESLDPNVTEVAILDGILDANKIVMVVSKKLEDGSWESSIDRIKAIQKACEQADVPFIFVCNAAPTEISAFKKKYGLSVPIFSMDEIELKIIARSNPAMVVLEKAVVKAKYPNRSIPVVKKFKEKHLK